MWYSERLDPNDLDYWPFGIHTEKGILRMPLKNYKKTNRRERESSFLLRASLDTQGLPHENPCTLSLCHPSWPNEVEGFEPTVRRYLKM